MVRASPERLAIVKRLMKQPPCEMDTHRRELVLEAIREVSSHRGWSLLAAHVRGKHVHVVVEADQSAEKVMNDFKAYASRSLNGFEPVRKRWARHGSTRHLWSREEILAAVEYVLYKQGEPMAVYCGVGRPPRVQLYFARAPSRARQQADP